MGKKGLDFKWRLLLLILPIALIPALVVVAISSGIMYSNLKEQTIGSYTQMLEQIEVNIDFVYDQHAMTFDDITLLENFNKIISHPPYKSKNEEINLQLKLGEDSANPKGGSIRRVVFAKLSGNFFILELNKKSLLDHTDYKLNCFSNISSIIFKPREMFDDKLYKRLKIDKKMVFGKLDKGTFNSFDSEKRSVFLYPYFKKGKKEFNEILILVNDSQFGSKFYKNIEMLKFGTLYILDANDNIISQNHPNTDADYYNFDKKKRKYTLQDGDDPNDPYESLSFNDYKLLNTDTKILQSKNIKKLLQDITKANYYYNNENMKIPPRNIITKYNKKKYFTMTSFSKKSNVKLIYFHPLKYIFSSINKKIRFIIIILIFFTILVVIISFIFSNIVTSPIKRLTKKAQKILKDTLKTNYFYKGYSSTQKEADILENKHNIYFSEFRLLDVTFNKMVQTINDYSGHLEELVTERTEELDKANRKLIQKSDFKSKYLANMSHEIRTPLNSILGFNQLLLYRNYDTKFEIMDLNDKILTVIENYGFNENILKIKNFCELFSNTISEQEMDLKYFYLLGLKNIFSELSNNKLKKEIELIVKEADNLLIEEDNKTLNNLKNTKRSCNYLLNLINSVLDIAKIESGNLEIIKKKVKINNLIDDIIIDAKSYRKTKGKDDNIEINFSIADSVPDEIVLDKYKIKEVLLNFLSNSIKFTKNGTVNLIINNKNDYLSFTVKDSGIGIKKEDLDILFTEFGRTTSTKNIEGTGLGLAISKKIVEIHGGRINVDSEYGKGTSFTIFIPLELETKK